MSDEIVFILLLRGGGVIRQLNISFSQPKKRMAKRHSETIIHISINKVAIKVVQRGLSKQYAMAWRLVRTITMAPSYILLLLMLSILAFLFYYGQSKAAGGKF